MWSHFFFKINKADSTFRDDSIQLERRYVLVVASSLKVTLHHLGKPVEMVVVVFAMGRYLVFLMI